MTNKNQKLDLIFPTLFLIAFIFLCSGLFWVFSSLDQKRKQEVLDKYYSETENYIDRNKEGLLIIFQEKFNQKLCDTQQNNYYYSYPNSCPVASGDDIANLLDEDIKDYSSMGFLKYDNGNIWMMGLSGSYNEIHPYPAEKEVLVKKILFGETDKIPWDEYSFELPNKDIVVPVKNNEGKVVGAIIRGVIE